MDYNYITFWGINIPKSLKNVMENANNTLSESFDNDELFKAYLLGVNNTISVLKQMLDSGVSKDSIAFYYPNADVEEEMTLDEVIEWVSGLEEN